MEEPPVDALCNWRELPALERRQWWDELWLQTLALADRYRLALRSGWWEDNLQVEALAAFHAWVTLYDCAAYSDPPGKIKLLWELEHLRGVLRPGDQAFDPRRDRPIYERHLAAIGCDGADETPAAEAIIDNQVLDAHRRALSSELGDISDRLLELAERQQLLETELERDQGQAEAAHPQQDLRQITRTIAQLRRRQQELRRQLEKPQTDDRTRIAT